MSIFLVFHSGLCYLYLGTRHSFPCLSPWLGFRSHVTSILIIALPCTMSEMLQFLSKYKDNKETIEWRCQRSPLFVHFPYRHGSFQPCPSYTLPSNHHSASEIPYNTVLRGGIQEGNRRILFSWVPLKDVLSLHFSRRPCRG